MSCGSSPAPATSTWSTRSPGSGGPGEHRPTDLLDPAFRVIRTGFVPTLAFGGRESAEPSSKRTNCRGTRLERRRRNGRSRETALSQVRSRCVVRASRSSRCPTTHDGRPRSTARPFHTDAVPGWWGSPSRGRARSRPVVPRISVDRAAVAPRRAHDPGHVVPERRRRRTADGRTPYPAPSRADPPLPRNRKFPPRCALPWKVDCRYCHLGVSHGSMALFRSGNGRSARAQEISEVGDPHRGHRDLGADRRRHVRFRLGDATNTAKQLWRSPTRSRAASTSRHVPCGSSP